jgi:hypothetical protein
MSTLKDKEVCVMLGARRCCGFRFNESGSGSGIQVIRIRIQGFDDRKIKKAQHFLIKNCIYLSLVLLKGRPSLYKGEAFRRQNTTSTTSKK